MKIYYISQKKRNVNLFFKINRKTDSSFWYFVVIRIESQVGENMDKLVKAQNAIIFLLPCHVKVLYRKNEVEKWR
jgi:hypothetical protein